MSTQFDERVTTEAPVVPARRLRLPEAMGVWEVSLAVLVVATAIGGSFVSPFFLSGQNFAITAAGAVGIALMVIPMTWLMIAGEIDLSIASIFGLSSVVFGLALDRGLPLTVALLIGLSIGALCGLVNGLLSVNVGLPSLIVTVGTLALYRGLAYVLLESEAISNLPAGFTAFAQRNVPGTELPYAFLAFVLVAAVAAVLLQRGSIGRKALAIGSNAQVARFSGIRVRRIKRNLFVLSGLLGATAGMLYSGYINSVRATNGTGLELVVIGIVLIGGVSMYGGKGSFVGVLLSLTLVTMLTSLMTLRFVSTDIQYMVTGLLMVAAVVVPAVAQRVAGRLGSS